MLLRLLKLIVTVLLLFGGSAILLGAIASFDEYSSVKDNIKFYIIGIICVIVSIALGVIIWS